MERRNVEQTQGSNADTTLSAAEVRLFRRKIRDRSAPLDRVEISSSALQYHRLSWAALYEVEQHFRDASMSACRSVLDTLRLLRSVGDEELHRLHAFGYLPEDGAVRLMSQDGMQGLSVFAHDGRLMHG